MRPVALILAVLIGGCAEPDHRAPAASDQSVLTIYSSTDTDVFEPVLSEFERLHPDIDVQFFEQGAKALYLGAVNTPSGQPGRADILISSSMDLQTKLVNDGYAMPHVSADTLRLPDWARWRDEAFGFTIEPAVMVYSRRLMKGRALPRSRPELIRALGDDPDFWRMRIGTYDPVRSSVGYLLMSQDFRNSSDTASLVTLMQQAQIQTADTTLELLERIERGELVLGYNVLESYARSRQAAGAALIIVYPEDYALALARTAVIPKTASNPAAARKFLDYLVSPQGQATLTRRSRLNGVLSQTEPAGREPPPGGPIRPISLGPGLLVYLDQQKRERLLSIWLGRDLKPGEAALLSRLPKGTGLAKARQP
ncbi:ABC transporter substrate-binding protein [Blastomonas sp.]|uniref:ABC transporter substrate-binding protein n=1 Tax=Blastomonas sp. TaxID=1909299 RepID=UPI00262A1A79|nr:ABC transporter substrate-binding protein [Blastomonas sp.]MDM7955768.1 ABC transporter substrate-binding protein [Blastomonas sp.]